MNVYIGLMVFVLSLPLMAGTASQPVPVTVKRFDTVAIEVIADAPAEIIVNNRPDISAELSAKVSRIEVLEGARVVAGEKLVALDCAKTALALDIARSTLRQSNARLNFARSQLQRANNLKKKNSISDELLDQRSTELKEATATQLTRQHQVKQAEIDAGHCNIHAPFDAVVEKRRVSEGSYVVPGTPVISLIRQDDAEVEAQLRQAQVSSISRSSSIWLEAAGQRYPLKLRTLMPVYDAISKTARAKLQFLQDRTVWPGQEVRLYWVTEDKQLPAEFVVRRNGRLGVFIVEQSSAVFYEIKDAVEGRSVKPDLEPGTQIVDQGRHRLNHADRVTVVRAE